MTQDEMIEAMARQLESAFQGLINNFHPYETVLSKEAGEHLARSLLPIIRAAMEPTSEMVEVGREAWLTTAADYTLLSEGIKAALIASTAASPLGEK